MQRPPAGSIPDAPGSYQFKDEHGRVIYVGKAKSLRQRLSNYFQTQPAAAHRPDGGHRRDRRVDPGPQRRRGAHARVQPHQAAPAPVQRPPGRRQELPVPRRHRVRRVAPTDGHARRADGRASATSGPTATRTRSARRSTCCCARSRLRTCSDNKFDRHEKLGRPCLLFHIEKCSGPCIGEVDKERLRHARRRVPRVPRRRHRHDRQAARDRDARGRRRAGVRAGGPAAGPARRRSARRSNASRWSPTATRTST